MAVGGGIPEALLERIRERTDIAALIGEYVQLKKQGKNYIGLCPFHEERTPSFTVSPHKQMFYCFGCQAGGSVFNFLMLKEDIPFAEAVRVLARRAGITLPEDDTPEARRKEGERAALLRAMELAARYFCARLADGAGETARGYLERRGLDAATVDAWRLGYAPTGWRGLSDALAGRGVPASALEKSGLSGRSTAGEGLYDRFRDRLMFPIADRRGRVIAFGGRALDDKTQPKYLNSPETPLFSKRRALYGFDRAREAIARRGEAVVVEGYLDLIAAHRAGVDWAVASLGTALSQEQAMEVSRLADNVVIAYDADSAGSQATLRGLEMFQRLGARVRVAELPAGEDPDSVFRARGAAGTRRAGPRWKAGWSRCAVPYPCWLPSRTPSSAPSTWPRRRGASGSTPTRWPPRSPARAARPPARPRPGIEVGLDGIIRGTLKKLCQPVPGAPSRAPPPARPRARPSTKRPSPPSASSWRSWSRTRPARSRWGAA